METDEDARMRWVEKKADPAMNALLPNAKIYESHVDDGRLVVIVGSEPQGWHMSISHSVRTALGGWQPGRYPTWDEIKAARYKFCPDHVTMAMLLPPKQEFVNVHETTFHLWEMR